MADLAAVQIFLTRHLQWILDAVKRYYSTSHPTGLRRQQDHLDQIRIESMITVPANCSIEACGIWRNAAHNAGMPNIDIRLEPLCAAASELEQLRQIGAIEYGDQMCFADIGKGTFDLATAKISRAATDDGQPELHTVGTPDGADLGAQMVNDGAWRWLLVDWIPSQPMFRATKINGICRLLGNMPPEAFHRRFADGFEVTKKDFAGDAEDATYSITIQAQRGWQQVPGSQPNLVIDMPQGAMESIFESWTLKLSQCLSAYLSAPEQEKTKNVMLTGASRLNLYVETQLRAHLARVDRKLFVSREEHPITTGGLRQYPRHIPAKLPHGIWYLVRGEELDKRRHRDAFEITRGPRELKDARSGKAFTKAVPLATPISSKVRNCSATGELEVGDRLAWFMTRWPGKSLKTRCLPLNFTIDAGSPPRLHFYVYYSSDKHREHGPLRDDDGEVKSDCSQYPFLFTDVGNLLDHGFKELGQTDTDWGYYSVTGLLSMNASETNITVTIRLLCPGDTLRFKTNAAGYDTNEVDGNAPYQIFYEHTQELWDTHRPHIAIDLAKQQAPAGPAHGDMATVAPNLQSPREDGVTGQCSQMNPSRKRRSTSGLDSCPPSHKRNAWKEDCDDEDDEEPMLQRCPSKRPNSTWSPVNGAVLKQQSTTSPTSAMHAPRTQAMQGNTGELRPTGTANRPQRTHPKPAGFYDLNV
ncbi:hypothetical protein LTR86_003063 [Recurvomyces mirabilis]|nr:hypothetical protein LTR86_003063 [Recurvomyces mirabilis]